MNIGGMSGGQPSFSAMRTTMDAKISENFATGDIGSSGGLSMDEFSAAHEARKADGHHGGRDGLQGARAIDGAKRPTVEDVFAKMDQDRDGQVTEAEMLASRPPPPPPPHGNFSANTLSGLLTAQENAQEDGINQILSAAVDISEGDEESEDDLISQLFEEVA